jgi:putative endopeptidase
MKATVRMRIASAVGIATFVAAVANGSARQATTPHSFGTWGVDLTARDTHVKAGDNFFAYANGAWLAKTEIPSDQDNASTWQDVYDLTQEQLRALIEASAANPQTPIAKQVGNLYKSFMDEARLETLDAKPLASDLASIAAVTTRPEFSTLMARTVSNLGISLFSLSVASDARRPVNTAYLGQGGLGMPDRDYYLEDRFKEKKQAYEAYMVRTFSLIKAAAPEASAKTVLAFETEVARASWSAADRRDIDKVYNPMTVEALQAFAPAIDWKTYFSASGLTGLDTLVLTEKTAVEKIAQIFEKTPLDTLKAWETFHVVDGASAYLSKRFVDSRFEFTGRALSGTPELRPRWKRGVTLVDSNLGEAVGKEYVAKYFPPGSKAKMEALVANLLKEMGARIHGLSWMSAPTKEQALLKLSRMKVMVGYPEKWRDYSALTLEPDDLYGNVERSIAFETAYQFGKVGKPVDRAEWWMTPQTVDAYNEGFENKIVFPAGILQPPFFNPAADPAVNYGAIGAIIGHEITHGFDDQGRKIDATGVLRDWWTAEDAKRFVAESDKIVAQFDSYEAVPGMHINGRLTLGENIADLGGLLVAIDAYHASLDGRPAPAIDGLTGDQRLFLSYAQAWRSKPRDDAVRAQIASNPHSPEPFRVIGPTRNVDGWYAAFDVAPAHKYFLKPENRARVW